MSYITPQERLHELGVDIRHSNIPKGMARGCQETEEVSGLKTWDEGVAEGKLSYLPEDEWDDYLEALDRGKSSIIDRCRADWKDDLTQGRCGYCWSYSMICAIQAAAAIAGDEYLARSAASVAAQIKNGRDDGGMPKQAMKFIKEHGVGPKSLWEDCNCRGNSCSGPRGGCPARDLSQVSDIKEEALRLDIEAYELPRNDFHATISMLLLGKPIASAWINTGAWCDGHAMGQVHVIKTNKRGYQTIPWNSWGEFKKHTPVSQAPLESVVLLHNKVR